MRETKCGWDFLIRYKDESEQWVPLKLLKESNPLEVAEFATVSKEPACSW